MNNQTKEIISGILLAFVIAMIISFLKTIMTDSYKSNEVNPVIMQKKEVNLPQKEIKKEFNKKTENIELKISPMIKLSGMSKKQILSLRKIAVKDSIFASENYIPNPDVFKIEDGLPWISAYEVSCNGAKDNKNIGKGASRESVGILNPEMLFYINIGATNFSKYNYCSKIDYLIPHKLIYSPMNKTITAYINYKDYYAKNKYFLNNTLTDTNARDFGYNYSYIDKFNNIKFDRNMNLSNSIVNIRGFYHKGYACGLPSGCNNISPHIPEYDFYLTKIPASFNIKLWKERPLSETEPADFNYKMVFE